MNKKKIIILGSTGSIGQSSIDVINKNKKDFTYILLSANNNFKKIIKQIKTLKPKIFVITNLKVYNLVKKKFKNSRTIIKKDFNILNNLKKNDITISAIPGIAGLEPTLISIKKTKKILIANKESIIYAWNLIKKLSSKHRTKIESIDSEHFSINKILEKFSSKVKINKIYLTASGGPFFNKNYKDLIHVSVADALKHPRWKMGKKITIDSATMMNKIFELIEAQKLFNLDINQIKIIIHPQSLIHGIVEFKNGLSYFLYHQPDMKIPIANCIYGETDKVSNLNFNNFNSNRLSKKLEFFNPKNSNYPILKIIKILKKYPSAGIIINSANEELVEQFLKGKILFTSIIDCILNLIKDKKFKKYAIQVKSNYKQIYFLDKWSRSYIKKFLSNYDE